MGNALGALAGGGMLMLIGLLVGRFFLQMGWLKAEKSGWLLRMALITLGVGVAYRLLGALIYFNIYGPVGDATEYDIIFLSKELKMMYEAIHSPKWLGPLRSMFAFLAHGLGSLLMGQYMLGGELAAFFCTLTGSGFFLARLQALTGKKTGEEIWLLFLCLPWGVFLFLPGWGPVAYLLWGAFFYFAGKLLPEKPFCLPAVGYGLALSFSSVLSAAMVFILATGKLA